ncbi:hypothetical protein IG631_18996 [Alternaria alternata]|nr:hypothetical protein IG631_18996 [Alternaria alternata]
MQIGHLAVWLAIRLPVSKLSLGLVPAGQALGVLRRRSSFWRGSYCRCELSNYAPQVHTPVLSCHQHAPQQTSSCRA